MKLTSGNRFARGFTMIEIMIACVILAIVMAAIYSVWFSILRGSRAGSKAAVGVQRGRIAMRAIEDALSTSQMYVLNARYYSFVADTVTDPDLMSLSLVSRLPANFPGGAIFGDLAVRRVTFTVEPGVSKADLVMRQVPVLMATNEVGNEYSISLVHNVKFFRMEFYDQEMADWVPEWFNTNQIPKQVRVALAYGGPENRDDQPSQVITRVVYIPASAIQPQYQMPRGGRGAIPGGLPPGGQPPVQGSPNNGLTDFPSTLTPINGSQLRRVQPAQPR
jgi:prepilin-type N-terminal cleavage/methylation domain-containing protein